MKYLQKDQLHLVNQKFHQSIIDAWERGENVPFGMTLVSDKVPTDKDVPRARELATKLGWKNV